MWFCTIVSLSAWTLLQLRGDAEVIIYKPVDCYRDRSCTVSSNLVEYFPVVARCLGLNISQIGKLWYDSALGSV